MFQKPSEPKPSYSDTKARPLSSELASVASSSSKVASTSPRQVASGPSTTTKNDYSRSDEQQSSQGQNRQQQPNKMSYSVNKQQIAATALHQHYLNYFNSNIPKEESKSQRTRGSISHSLSQTRQLLQQQQLPQAVYPNQDHHPAPPQLDNPIVPPVIPANQKPHHLQHHNHIYHIPAALNHHHPPNNQHNHHYASPANHATASVNDMSRSIPRDTDIFMSHKMTQQQQPPHKQTNSSLNHRTYSTGAIASSHPQQQQHQQYQSQSMNPNKQQQHHATTKILARSTRRGQLDKDSEDKAAAIKGELENDLEGYKNSELEAISSLERTLPIELSFLIRQQAHCIARMNYLDRQFRELQEKAFHLQQQHHHPHHQQIDAANQVSSTSIINQGHNHQHYNVNSRRQHQYASDKMQTGTTVSHTKNGNFILSDDSGGEYSRATISDDDELSSLLDQIVKSVRPDQQQQQQQRPMMINNTADAMLSGQMHNLQQQQRITANSSTFMSNPSPPHLQHQQQQSYLILNPNQMHHHQQAVPIFVMNSPIAVAHPSSISSNILPGVHFQPEPRYNQYYEDFYNVGTAASHSISATRPPPSAPPPPMQHRASNNGFKSQQFESSMSAVEQLVSQKEKRQIISQLKSADNWLKMRASSQEQESSSSVIANKQVAAAVRSSHQADAAQTTTFPSANGGELRTNSSSTVKQEGGDCVIDENVDE